VTTICKRCLMPDTRPRVRFYDGVCNACLWADEKRNIDWKARKEEFLALIAEHRGDGPYDCVVPFSGGKDSASIAYRLKYEFGLNPLLATYGQLLWTDCGRHNYEQVSRLGFDCIYWRVNQKVSRHLARRFLIERGHPKQHYDAGVNSCPVLTAKQFDIPLIFYAEHGESEYGGHVMSEESRRTRDLNEVLEHQVGDHPLNWVDDVVDERDLAPYIYPDDVEGLTAYYFSYFFPWDIKKNADLCMQKFEFQAAPGGRSDGTFDGYDSIDDKIDDLDFYMMHIKFGFGRATRMASRLIQNGHLTREEGLRLVKEYDGEYPTKYLGDVLEYLQMSEAELKEVIQSHRNPEIWDGERLRHEVC